MTDNLTQPGGVAGLGYGGYIALAVGAGYDVRHVEAFMRADHPTLDGLSRDQFIAEAKIAARCVDEAGLEWAEKLARSFGL